MDDFDTVQSDEVAAVAYEPTQEDWAEYAAWLDAQEYDCDSY